jgi:toxin YoeB
MNLVWTPTAWNQYVQWQSEDKKIIKRINELIKDILRNGPLNGIGKPEPLKHIKACSRRINEEHRLVYIIDQNESLIILACRGHYSN